MAYPIHPTVQQFGTSVTTLGAAGMSNLTLPGNSAAYHQSAPSEMAGIQGQHPAEGGSPKMILVGMILAIAALWLIRHNSAALEREVIGVNIYNLLLITFTAVIGIWLGKLVFSRFPVPGFTQVFAGV